MRTLRIASYEGYGPTDDAIALTAERIASDEPGILVESVDLYAYPGRCLDALRDGRLDLCLTAAPDEADYAGLVREPLMRDRLAVLARRDAGIACHGLPTSTRRRRP